MANNELLALELEAFYTTEVQLKCRSKVYPDGIGIGFLYHRGAIEINYHKGELPIRGTYFLYHRGAIEIELKKEQRLGHNKLSIPQRCN